MVVIESVDDASPEFLVVRIYGVPTDLVLPKGVPECVHARLIQEHHLRHMQQLEVSTYTEELTDE